MQTKRVVLLAFSLAVGFSASDMYAQKDLQVVENAQPAVAVEVEVAVDGAAGEVALFLRNDNGQVDPATTRLNGYVRVESALVRRVCKLSDEQEKSLCGLNDAWVKKNSDAAAKPAINLLGNLLGGAAVQPAMSTITPVNRIQNLYRAEITKILTPEQMKAYEAEAKTRQEFKCRANAECIIAMLERKVCLKDEQRESLSNDLAKWKGIGDVYTAFYFQNENYFPNIPRSLLQKHLTANQMGVVNSLQTVQFQREQFQDDQAIVIRR
jgi:hypothetical protein